MMFFLKQGYRVIAHDRRGHGRSGQSSEGNNMETYAADVAELTAALDLKNAIHIGHSTGGGEVIRYAAKYGKERVAKAIIISAVTPIMIKNEANPDGVPLSVFDEIREGTGFNRAQYFYDFPIPFYGWNREGKTVQEGINQAPKAAKLLKNGKLISYPGFPHGMPTTEAETINKDILEFIKS
jgi:non-heme chloroperoxidase